MGRLALVRIPMSSTDIGNGGAAVIEDIRRRFPNPIAAPPRKGRYCVGGAICKAVGIRSSFPWVDKLEKAFIRLGADPEHVDFEHLCYLLLEYNDNEDFDDAWGLAAEIMEKKA